MAFTLPATWQSQLVTVAQFNQQIRDNMNALKDPPGAVSYISANYTGASAATFANVDPNDVDGVFRHTLTLYGTFCSVRFAGTMHYGNANANGALNISVNGNDYFPFNSGFQRWNMNAVAAGGGVYMPLSFDVLLTGLTAGANTVRLRWAVSHTATRLVGSGDAGAMVFAVKELP